MKTLIRFVPFALFAIAPALSTARTVLESPPLAPGRAFFAVENTGTLQAKADGWIRYEPRKSPRETSTIRIDLSEHAFRTWNQAVIEVENENDSTRIEAKLRTELPKWDDLKMAFTAKRGRSEASLHFPGVGAPAHLRELRLDISHGKAEGGSSEASRPILFRLRMRLDDWNLNNTLRKPVAEALDHALPEGFLPEEKDAAEARRRSLRALSETLFMDAFDGTRPYEVRLRALNGLWELRDGTARRIEAAAFDAAAKSAAKRHGILHAVAPGCEKIGRLESFPGTVCGAAAVSAARGEAEGVQIALRASAALRGVSAQVLPLVADDGSRLPASAVSLAPVGFVRPTPAAYIPSAQFRETIPDPILQHASSVDLSPGMFQPWWLDVDVPADAAPGLYRGEVLFRDASGSFSQKVPVEVRVRSFALPAHRSLPVAFGGGFSAKSAFIRAYEKDAATLAAYGDFLHSPDGDASRLSPRLRRLWDVSLGLYRLLAKHNVPPLDIYGSVRDVEPPWLRDLQLAESPDRYCIGYDNAAPIVERVAAHLEPMRRAGVADAAILYGFDEIRMSDTRAFQGMKRDFGAVKKAYPEVLTMCTALDGSFGEKSDTTEEVDVWVWPEDSYVGSRKAAERARARGKQVWFYPCNWPVLPHANLHLESPAVSTRVLMGLFPFKYKSDGILYYATANLDSERSTTLLSAGWKEFSPNARIVRYGVTGLDVDVRCTPTPGERRCVVGRWQNLDKDVDCPAPLRVQGQVRVDRFTPGDGAECRIEVRFLYQDRPKGKNEDRRFVEIDASRRGWQTIDAEIRPDGTIANCYFALRVTSPDADVTFRDVCMVRPGETTHRRLGLERTIGSGPVLDEPSYSMFRSNGDGSLVYPGPEGAIPSTRLKFVRDGIDDYEYLVLLQSAADRVRKGALAVPDRVAFLREADALLSVPDNLCRGTTGYPESAAPVLAWRHCVADLLETAEESKKP